MAFLGRVVRAGLSAVVLGGVALGATGCSGFFQCEGKPSCPSTGSGTGTGTGSTVDYAYVSNSASGPDYIDGFAVSGGTLTATTSSPYNLGFVPLAMVVSPNNSFLYVATTLTTTGGGIYGYSIGTGGALSVLNSGNPLISEPVAAMTMSPDGKYLFALNSTQETLDEIPANSTSGVLSSLSGSSIYGGVAGATVIPTSVVVAPSGNFIVCVLGTGGVVTFPYTASTGVIGAQNSSIITPQNSQQGFYAAAVDANNYLYVAGTNGLYTFSTNSSGAATQQSTTTAGNAPRAMILNTGYNYLYTANQTDGTITADTVGTTGVLTAISGSAFTGPVNVTALGVDSSDKYVVAAGYSGSSGIQLFSIGTGGALTSLGSAASGTSGALPIIAMTH